VLGMWRHPGWMLNNSQREEKGSLFALHGEQFKLLIDQHLGLQME